MTLTASQNARFRRALEDRRELLLGQARGSRQADLELSSDDRPDEADLAASDALQSFILRLRGREAFLLHKIERALAKIASGTYGICEECEEPIPLRRLLARPEAPLCITCKEAEEQRERLQGDEDSSAHTSP